MEPVEHAATAREAGRDDGVDYFVVRAKGVWTATPVPVAEPATVDVEAIVDRIRSGAGVERLAGSPPAQVVAPVSLQPTDVLAPVWMSVGLVAAGHLLISDPDGGVHRLGESEVRAMDELRGPTYLRDLPPYASSGPVVANLLAAGCVRRSVSSNPSSGPDASGQGGVPAPGGVEAATVERVADGPAGSHGESSRTRDALSHRSKLKGAKRVIRRFAPRGVDDKR